MHRDAGSTPYLIPVGGSTTVGAWGYIEAFRELMNQVRGERPRIIYVSARGTTSYDKHCVLVFDSEGSS